jgi:hypothetical protein
MKINYICKAAVSVEKCWRFEAEMEFPWNGVRLRLINQSCDSNSGVFNF